MVQCCCCSQQRARSVEELSVCHACALKVVAAFVGHTQRQLMLSLMQTVRNSQGDVHSDGPVP